MEEYSNLNREISRLINGNSRFQWTAATFEMYGANVIGITSFFYKIKRTFWGLIGEGGLILYTDQWRQVINASPNNDPTKIKPTDFKITYQGNGAEPVIDILVGVTFPECPFGCANSGLVRTNNLGSGEGPITRSTGPGIMVEVPIKFKRIIFNYKAPSN